MHFRVQQELHLPSLISHEGSQEANRSGRELGWRSHTQDRRGQTLALVAAQASCHAGPQRKMSMAFQSPYVSEGKYSEQHSESVRAAWYGTHRWMCSEKDTHTQLTKVSHLNT